MLSRLLVDALPSHPITPPPAPSQEELLGSSVSSQALTTDGGWDVERHPPTRLSDLGSNSPRLLPEPAPRQRIDSVPVVPLERRRIESTSTIGLISDTASLLDRHRTDSRDDSFATAPLVTRSSTVLANTEDTLSAAASGAPVPCDDAPQPAASEGPGSMKSVPEPQRTGGAEGTETAYVGLHPLLPVRL